MKLSDFSIKHIWSNLREPRKSEFRTISTKAHHDWKVILFGFLLVSIAVMVINMLLFFRINSGELFSPASPVSVRSGVVSKKNLEDTVKFFAERQTHLQELKTTKPTVADPSL